MKHQTNRKSLFATALGVFALAATSANAAVILADDFTGHSWSGNNVTVGGGAWDTESGLSASVTIGFDYGQKATGIAGVINPNNKATTGGYDATITLTIGAQAIDLGALNIGYHLLDGNGNPQSVASNKSGETNISFDNSIGLAGSIPLSGYTLIGGDPDVTIDRSIDLTGTTLAANTTYVMTIDSFGGGDGHFKALDYLELNGTVVPEPSSVALLGLGGLALLSRRRK